MKKMLAVALILVLSISIGGWTSPGGLSGGGVGGSSAPSNSLPDTIFVAEGRQCNIWFDQYLASVPGADYFTVAADADSGSIWKRSWRWTPQDLGPDCVPLTLRAISPDGKTKKTSTVYVQSVDKNAGYGTKQVLMIGDSILGTDTHRQPATIQNLVDYDGGANIKLLGTVGADSIYDEAYGGKGIRYFTGATSPFWNTDHLDFQNYMSDNSYIGDIDYAVIQIGANDCSYIHGYDALTEGELDSLVTYENVLIDSLLAVTTGYPDCRVIVGLCGYPSNDLSSFGQDYKGADWWVVYKDNLTRYNNRMIQEYDNGARYGQSVDVCYAGLWVDREYGHAYTSVAVSSRSALTENTYSANSYLHPNTSGLQQMGDAVYSHIRQLMYTDPDPTCENRLADSHNWATANGTYWTNAGGAYSTYWPMTGGQTDPWGGSDATLFTGSATVIAGLWDASSIVVVNNADVVVSFFVKKTGTLDANDITDIRIVDTETGGNPYAATRITWAATPTASGAGTLRVGGGIDERVDLGSGWYQIWVHAHLTTTIGNDFSARICPVDTNAGEGDAIIVAGAQMEFGVTAPCGTYVEKP